MTENIEELLSVITLLDDELTSDDLTDLTIKEFKNLLDQVQLKYSNHELRIELNFGQYSDGDIYPRISFMRLENEEEREKRLSYQSKI